MNAIVASARGLSSTHRGRIEYGRPCRPVVRLLRFIDIQLWSRRAGITGWARRVRLPAIEGLRGLADCLALELGRRRPASPRRV